MTQTAKQMELQVPTKGSVVIVFGASRGIGAEIAKTFGRSIKIDFVLVFIPCL